MSLSYIVLSPSAIVWRCVRDPVFSPFATVAACDRRTDRRTLNVSIYRANTASRDKKRDILIHW